MPVTVVQELPMNNCVLMAEIVQDPQLRYTQDNQVPVAEMMVQFPALRADDPPSLLRVVGWRNLAQEIQERYHKGDRVIIEGSLRMNSVDRPEGFKEKVAELIAQRIHPITTDALGAPALSASASVPASTPAPGPATPTTPPDLPDYDEIPF
jgi:single-stranded DNA-binding protein